VRRFLAALLLCTVVPASHAAVVTYANQATFLGSLGSYVLDDYSAAGYGVGDVTNSPTFDLHTNASMSAVLGETSYQSTGFANLNIISTSNGDGTYCAGCNGSFRLDFTSTSVGSVNGIYGFGFNFKNFSSAYPYVAFVTFGDNTTANYLLPLSTAFAYFGLTTDQLVKSVHLGLANGVSTQSGAFLLDNLTIGAAPVPLPAAAWLLLSGLGGLGLSGRPRKA
jgi:hypothetical protein